MTFWYDTESVSNKSKNKQVHQTKKLLHNKGNNQQNEKATYRVGEIICKLYIHKVLTSKIYKEIIYLKSKEKRI